MSHGMSRAVSHLSGKFRVYRMEVPSMTTIYEKYCNGGEGSEGLSDWKRVPGLFRRWELSQLIEEGAFEYVRQGCLEDGSALWAVYRLVTVHPDA